MTREEAIQILADLIDSPFLHTWEKQNKALHMAIEALSAEPKMKVCEERQNGECPFYTPDWLDDDVSEPSDLISRADALEAIFKVGHEHVEENLIPIGLVTDYSDAIRTIPSADTVSREDTVTLNSPISIQAEMVAVVRCKDCKHRDLFSCPLTDNDFQKDEDFCSWGELKGGDDE